MVIISLCVNLFKAVAFLVPTFMWHNLEGGRVASLALDEVRENYHEVDRWRHSVDSFVITLRQNNWYLTKFLFCEIFQLMLLLSIIHTTDLFLSGMFYTLGPKTMDYLLTPAELRTAMVNPVCQVFPTVTSCQFPSGSLTGTVNIDHALCVLSLNIVNDKIFLIEWFWFFFLILIAIISSFSRGLTLILPYLRIAMLKSTDISYDLEDDRVIKRVVAKCKLGDWFLLTLIKKNLDDRQFTTWIKEVDERINGTVKKERVRRREERNGHNGHHWGRGGGGQAQVRERKCYTVESAESRSDREEVSDNCA